jgi:DNA-directed RNA polymerase specialized sigma24 family protein
MVSPDGASEAALRSVLEMEGPMLEAFARALLGDHACEAEAVVDSVCLNVLVGVLTLPLDPTTALRALLGEIHRVIALMHPGSALPEASVANDNGQSRAA